MKVYVAGPMTGLPEHNFPAFMEAARVLRARGHEVVNPAEITQDAYEAPGQPQDWAEALIKASADPWHVHVARDLAQLLTCEAVALLPGWQASRGAKVEVAVARSLGLMIFDFIDADADPAHLVFKARRDPGGITRAELIARNSADVIIEEGHIVKSRLTDVVTDPRTGAMKADGRKPRTDLLPVLPLLSIAEVFRFGAEKYAPRNWEKGFDWSRPYGALLRHVFAWWIGEDNDPETGMSHLAHAGCDLLMLLEFISRETGNDDRPGQPSRPETPELC